MAAPPLQQHAPVGLRCFTGLPPPSSATHSTRSIFRLSSQRPNTAPDEGLLVHQAVSAGDMQIDAGSSKPSLRRNEGSIAADGADHAMQSHRSQRMMLYPASSLAFHKLVAEDSTKPFDVLHLYPEDLRRDVPAFRGALRGDAFQPHPPAAPLVTDRQQLLDAMINHNLITAAASSSKINYLATATLTNAVLNQAPSCTLWELRQFVAKHCTLRVSAPLLRSCLQLLINMRERIAVGIPPAAIDAQPSQLQQQDVVVATSRPMVTSRYSQRVCPQDVPMKRKRRVVGVPPDATPVAAKSKKWSLSVDTQLGLHPSVHCTCAAHLLAAPSEERQVICGVETCAAPHVLVYEVATDLSKLSSPPAGDDMATATTLHARGRRTTDQNELTGQVLRELQLQWELSWDALPLEEDIAEQSSAQLHCLVSKVAETASAAAAAAPSALPSST